MANITWAREELKLMLKQYELIRDCLAGEQQVKMRRMKYLPMPNADDVSPENIARYNGYLTRAVFYNVAQRTQQGLRGQIFLRDPLIEVPALLEPVIEDATGSGVPIEQLAQEAVDKALAFGRLGLYVDYPDTGGAATVDQVNSGEAKAQFKVVDPIDVINWRVKSRGAKIILAMVVFREDYEEESDGFETKRKDQWRVLRLVPGEGGDVYQIEIYRDKNGAKPIESYIPTDAGGKPFNEIAFTFIGSVSNDATVDLPPMYDLCSLNVAHYRNSADYEESVYYVGQPTPWVSGLSESWVKEVLGGAVRLGSRAIIPLPVDGSAGLLQAEPNTLAKEAMDQKEKQMLALGAKLVEGSQVERTATEADIDNVSETSVLSTVAKNVASAFEWGLKYAARFTGQAEDGIAFELNTEFDLVNLSPEERKTLLAEYQAGVLTWTEVRDSLRRAGIASLSDKDAKAETDKEHEENMNRAVEEAAKTAEATNLPDPNDAPGNVPPKPGA